MKLIIAGSRNLQPEQFPDKRLDELHKTIRVTEVVSGGAWGADYLGEVWAEGHELPIMRFNADWDKYGKRAGPIRNRLMAEHADAVVLLPGGIGTASMAREAARAGIIIHDWRDEQT